MRAAFGVLKVLTPVVVALVWLTGLSASPSAAAPTAPTFAKDVAPILFRSCVECHRATGMAPMSLMTYDEVRPWARALRQKVVSKEMPPWGADPAVGTFANDISLSPEQIAMVSSWVDAGAPEGNK